MATAVDTKLLTSLSTVYMFSQMSDKHLRHVAGLGKVVQHQAGHMIVAQGDPALSFHLLLDGTAEVLVNDAVRRTLGPGDYFGEVAVIDRQRRSASVRATSPTRTWALSGGALKVLLDDEPSVAHALILGLCSRLRELEGLPLQRS